MTTRISIDVDLTIVGENEELFPGVVEGLKALKDKGYILTLWSYGGEERARLVAKENNLTQFFDGYACKPDLVIDDDAEMLSQLPTVDALNEKGRPIHWSKLSRFLIDLAEDIDERSLWKDVPTWIQAMTRNKYDVGVQSAVAIWRQRETYIRWPRHKRLLWDGLVRHPGGKSRSCYVYSPDLETEIVQAGYKPDRRNNGPAIHAFQLAGGERPRRPYPSKWGWTIHHIYDGQHRRRRNEPVPRAVKEKQLFTEAAGLVAVHPFADYVAMNVPLLAWLLRWEAFRRFNFDPMNIFTKHK